MSELLKLYLIAVAATLMFSGFAVFFDMQKNAVNFSKSMLFYRIYTALLFMRSGCVATVCVLKICTDTNKLLWCFLSLIPLCYFILGVLLYRKSGIGWFLTIINLFVNIVANVVLLIALSINATTLNTVFSLNISVTVQVVVLLSNILLNILIFSYFNKRVAYFLKSGVYEFL